MGMFNYVKFKAPCKNCGKILDNFQTKDCEEDLGLIIVEPATTKNFYDNCDDCYTWNEYEVIKKPLSIEFKLTK